MQSDAEPTPTRAPEGPPAERAGHGLGLSSVTAVMPTESELIRLDPRVKTAWWIGGALSLLQLLVPLALADRLIPHPLPTWRVTAAVAVVGAVMAAIVPPIRFRIWRYVLREHDLWIRRGLLMVVTTVVPYRRLQFVDTRSGPIERMLGLATLVVHTAALGTSATVPGLDRQVAEDLRERLSALEPADAHV